MLGDSLLMLAVLGFSLVSLFRKEKILNPSFDAKR
jgi:hypothetical protein